MRSNLQQTSMILFQKKLFIGDISWAVGNAEFGKTFMHDKSSYS